MEEVLVKKEDKETWLEESSSDLSLQTPLDVLVIEDDEDSALILEHVLNQLNCRVRLVFDGYQAIYEISEKPFDLIILDWVMPGISGAETLRNMDRVLTWDSFTSALWDKKRLSIVTYSSTPITVLDIPISPFFRYLAHWQKPLTYSQLKDRANEIFDTQGWRT